MDKDVSFYTLSSTAIIHELLGEEVIIANLDNGNYYNLSGLAATVWRLLLCGKSAGAAITEIQEHYSGVVDVELQAASFIEELLQHNLLKLSASAIVSGECPTQWPQIFKSGAIDCYEDMQQLLVLDPIHEVDELGWPHAKDPVV
ncbi:MAG: PqqD family protein [Gammaproteobacteria bacterium]|nr:PqqD family protein [Gammaproteobacteria bacterium]